MHILVSYRGIPSSPGWATGDFVTEALRRAGHDVFPYGNYYQTNERIEGLDPQDLLSQKYDLTIFMECNDADPQYNELSRNKNLKTDVLCSWLFDTSYYSDHLKTISDYFNFDLNFIANPAELKRFKNSKYLPYAADLVKHCKSLRDDYENIPALFGTIRKDRLSIVKGASHKGILIKLVEGKFRENYIEALSRTAITVNQNPRKGRGLLNMRSFEAPACGSILMLEERDYLLNPGVFQDKQNCYVYKNHNDLFRKIKTLQRDNQILNEIRLHGYNNIIANHTYDNRVKTLIESL